MDSGSGRENPVDWKVCGQNLPREEIVYFSQVTLVYLVVAVSLANLSLGRDPTDLWLSLLCSAVAYCLPSPNLKQK